VDWRLFLSAVALGVALARWLAGRTAFTGFTAFREGFEGRADCRTTPGRTRQRGEEGECGARWTTLKARTPSQVAASQHLHAGLAAHLV
jgi:hypothetical protein